jgi:hypothetical protein
MSWMSLRNAKIDPDAWVAQLKARGAAEVNTGLQDQRFQIIQLVVFSVNTGAQLKALYQVAQASWGTLTVAASEK